MIYAKAVQSSHPTFQNRETVITTSDEVTRIPVPNNITLCDGCNQNIEEGYLVYLGKRELKQDRPYDYFCESCLNKYFPKHQKV